MTVAEVQQAARLARDTSRARHHRQARARHRLMLAALTLEACTAVALAVELASR